MNRYHMGCCMAAAGFLESTFVHGGPSTGGSLKTAEA